MTETTHRETIERLRRERDAALDALAEARAQRDIARATVRAYEDAAKYDPPQPEERGTDEHGRHNWYKREHMQSATLQACWTYGMTAEETIDEMAKREQELAAKLARLAMYQPPPPLVMTVYAPPRPAEPERRCGTCHWQRAIDCVNVCALVITGRRQSVEFDNCPDWQRKERGDG